MANQKFGNLGNLENLGDIVPRFVISEFSILPYPFCPIAKIENTDLKNLKIFFSCFRVLNLALSRPVYLASLARVLLFVPGVAKRNEDAREI